MKKLFHFDKSGNDGNQNEPTSYQEPSFENSNNVRAKRDEERIKRKTRDESKSSMGRSTSKQEKSNTNRDYKNRRTKSKTKTDDFTVKREKRKRGRDIVVEVPLPISVASKLDDILFLFPRFQKCFFCMSLRTGCFLISWTQIVGSLIVGCLQGFISLICYDHIDPEKLFGIFPKKFNPAKTVSEFADDYCAGLSMGYALGELFGFVTGIMLLTAVWNDRFPLIRLWIYGVLIMMLPTLTFYGVALYAMIEFNSDVPVIAVPSTIELVSFVVLCFCTSIVKSYYYSEIERLYGIRHQESIFLQAPAAKEPQEV
ncbi:hypothetical protein GE061_012596 [Apolygus lucorum]|uniref:Uncharacterized protein n=1 Tax=Apolygus lucorum TaxID=248454 RepID=A0A8S9XVG2_APOLU|nr:hypothetical protein GE061_012596 [Apolygus lucorum]